MRPLDRIGFFKDGRMTLGACTSLALAAVAIGLVAMMAIPVAPPDAAFSARAAMWRSLPKPVH